MLKYLQFWNWKKALKSKFDCMSPSDRTDAETIPCLIEQKTKLVILSVRTNKQRFQRPAIIKVVINYKNLIVKVELQ